MSVSDAAILSVIVLFFAAFSYAAFSFLRKKKKERHDDLMAVLPTQEELNSASKEAMDKKPVDLGLALLQTKEGLWGKIAYFFAGDMPQKDNFAELERILFGADLGVQTAEYLLSTLRAASSRQASLEEIKELLKKEITHIFEEVKGHGEGISFVGDSPCVVLFVGVNGVGKTTTIGKIAAQAKSQGKKVLLGAGDTFRAAASEQLSVWSERAGVSFVQGEEGSDPASVLFEACLQGKNQGVDLILCDTAGRLHTKNNLMDELSKVKRVIGKAIPGAPHEIWLVLDASMGQNALMQAKQFLQSVSLSGIVLTKLDGTAKGGVVIGIVHQLKIPVRMIGVGEGISDLRPFDPAAFVEALFV